MPRQFLGEIGTPTLIAAVKQAIAQGTVNNQGLLALGNLLQQSLGQIEDALNDYPKTITVELPVTGWAYDDTATHDYKYSYTIQRSGVVATDFPIAGIGPDTIATASQCRLSSIESITDGVKFYAASVPSKKIQLSMMILPGKEDTVIDRSIVQEQEEQQEG